MNIVKGLITSIDFNGNTCVVRLPLFESAANEKELLVTATFATQPGIYNGYKVNDVIYVAFENNEIGSPVVIGKLYLGADKESKDPRGAINAENLKSATPMTLPIDTHLTLDNDQESLTNVNVDGELAGYKTIADFARKLKKQDTTVGSLNIKVIDDGARIGNLATTKVSKQNTNSWTESERTLGFGWDINDQQWRVYSSDSSRIQNPELDVLTVDPHGVTIMGDVKIVGYPTATLVLYNQTALDASAPDFTDSQWTSTPDYPVPAVDNKLYPSASYPIVTTGRTDKWQTTEPAWDAAKLIWQKTITFSYQPETEDGRKVVNEYWISTTVCISGSVGPKGDPGRGIESVEYKSSAGKVDTYAIKYTDGSNDDYFDVTNGADGQDGQDGQDGADAPSITSVITYYNFVQNGYTPTEAGTQSYETGWYTDPEQATIPSAWEAYHCWLKTITNYSDSTSTASSFVKDPTYALAQGKSTNYYSAYDPTTSAGGNHKVKKGDNWFKQIVDTITTITYDPLQGEYSKYEYNDISYDGIDQAIQNASSLLWNEYSGKYCYLNNEYIELTNGDSPIWRDILDVEVSENDNETYDVMVSINDSITLYTKNETTIPDPDKPIRGELKQWNGTAWESIDTEIVANKVTAEYINAMDITAQKIKVLQIPTDATSSTLFEADGTGDSGQVTIAGFTVANRVLSNNEINKILFSGNLNEDGSIYISPGFKYLVDDQYTEPHYTEPIAIKVGKNFEVSANGDVTIKKLSINPDPNTDSFSFNIVGDSQTMISPGGKLSCTNAELTDATIDAIKLSFDTIELTKAVIGSTQTYNIIFDSNNDATFETDDNTGNVVLTRLQIKVKDSNLSPYTGNISKSFKLTVEYRVARDYVLDTRTYVTLVALNGWTNEGNGVYKLAGQPIVISKPAGENIAYSVKSCSLAPKTLTVGATAEVLQINSSFTPTTTDIYNLGDTNNKWNAVYAVNGVVNTSDIKEKNTINYNLSNYDTFFDSLKPASFKFNKTHFNRTHLGLIAQDVQESLFKNNLTRKDFGGLVLGGDGFDAENDQIIDEDTTTYGIGYSELHALEIYEIQKLKKEIKELKEELATLKQK